NPNIPDTNQGLTPLCWAARNCNDAVVKTLLACEDVNPNTPDTIFGRTPLCWATQKSHYAVVETLVGREDVNPNTAGIRYGRTPRLRAVAHRHADVVKIILERADIHVDTPDNKNKTPLSLALSEGHNEVAEMLQDRINGSSETADDGGHALPSLSVGQECALVMQSGSGDVGPDITGLDRQNANSSGDLDEEERILDCKETGSSSGESHPPSSEHFGPLPPSPECSLSSSPGKTDTPFHNAGSTLLVAVNQYLLISSFICLLTFLIYIFSFSLPSIFSFHK
ncbi:ankyrin, partial [Choiromyces venosus 120613-1]